MATAATQNISIRVAVVDGDKTRRELTLTGEAGQRALAKIKEATAPAGKSLAALNVVGEQLRYGMESVAASGGELAASLGRLGPAGLAAAAAIGALLFGLSAGLKEIANVEQANLRLAAVLRATGSVAGLTKQEIDDLADSMESSTLRTAEEVKDAASILLTFRSVTGDVFKEALKYAADAQTVFGGDLSSSVTRLGKALEDPIEGLGA
ncbi:MAG: hypothetical protein EBV03_07195, partial [Proteobacteria bacterium]|nr:hypothetical protein [Pseudomonadota bacterium]